MVNNRIFEHFLLKFNSIWAWDHWIVIGMGVSWHHMSAWEVRKRIESKSGNVNLSERRENEIQLSWSNRSVLELKLNGSTYIPSIWSGHTESSPWSSIHEYPGSSEGICWEFWRSTPSRCFLKLCAYVPRIGGSKSQRQRFSHECRFWVLTIATLSALRIILETQPRFHSLYRLWFGLAIFCKSAILSEVIFYDLSKSFW
jgi:hypothetical protein